MFKVDGIGFEGELVSPNAQAVFLLLVAWMKRVVGRTLLSRMLCDLAT